MTSPTLASILPWYSDDYPQVSIVLLNFDNAQMTIECLKNIWEHTQGYRYEIIVVDNGSHHDDFQALFAFKGSYKLLRLEVNRFFGEGSNIGTELANGEFILFMHNDVIVTSNWLPPLVEAFENYTDCGAAGPKLVYPNGLLQEAGVLLDEEGMGVQIGKFQDPDSARFNCVRTVDFVSAAAVLMRKTTFENVLGFDFIFEPACYEDSDLCLKIGQIGLKTLYIPESCVVHHENTRVSKPRIEEQTKNFITVNREKFVNRWSHYLKTGRHDGTIPAFSHTLKPAKRGEGPTAAFFTPYNIIPGGGERYLLTAAEVLIQAGYQVWLVTPEKYSYLRLTKVAVTLGLSLQGLAITTVEEAGKMPSFDVFVALGNEIAPPVWAMGRTNFYCCQFPFPCAQEEIDHRRGWMAQYDAIVVYSYFVKGNVLKQLSSYGFPSVDIHVVHPPVGMLPFVAEKSRNSIISVGRFFTEGHCKRQDMLIRAFRQLHEAGIQAELHLVGSLTPELQNREYFVECQRLALGLPVRFHVDAPLDTLTSLYENASVYWHGSGFGIDENETPEKCEHFGISVVEAMSTGAIPFVVNNGGPAVTVEHGLSGFCYDTEDELVELTRKVFAQPEDKVAEIRANARIRAMDFSKESFAKHWLALLS